MQETTVEGTTWRTATQPEPEEAVAWAIETKTKMVDLKFCDLLGAWQHMTLPVTRVRRVGVRRGTRLRRLVDPRLAGDRRERPPAHARSGYRDARPLHRGAHPLARLRDRRPDYRRALRARPAAHRPAGGGAPPRDRNRRHGELRPRVRVLRLRRGLLRRSTCTEPHYEVDSAEGHWNSGSPGLGYTVREKGGYFPPAPHDTLADLRTEIVLTLERLGIPCEFHHHEVASGGPVRDRSPVPEPDCGWPTRS